MQVCPELVIASQGDSLEEARDNLIEALELFFKTAPDNEIQVRLRSEIYITRVSISIA